MRQALAMYFLILVMSWATTHAQSLLPTQKEGKWGLMDSTGKTLIPFTQDRIRYLADGDDIFMAGLMWLGLPFAINKLDPSLPNLKASGE